MKNTILHPWYKLIVGCLIVGMSQRGNAQLVGLFTQYTDLQTFINPATLPSDFVQYNQKAVAGLYYRSQWLRIEGAPNTALGRFDYTLEGNTLSTFGGFLLSDVFGAQDIKGVYGRYAYQIRPSVQEDMFIGIGLLAGMLQYRVNAAKLEFKPEDQLQGEQVTRWVPDFGIGFNFLAYPQRGMKFYAGISLPQVTSQKIHFQTQRNLQEFILKRPIHIMGTLGFVIPVGQQGFIEPSVWFKQTKGQPLNVDINVRQKFINNFWLGAGYSSAKAIHIEGGLILSESIGLPQGLLRLGYGFDYNIAGFGAFLGTTHEINISYAFGSVKY